MQSLLTVEEAAIALKVSKRTAYSYIKSGTLPASKIGGQWRIKSKHLDFLLFSNENRVSEDERPHYELKASTSKTNSAARQATLGFESKLWQTADVMRNTIDPAEFKHVVLGLMFLRSLSIATKSKYKKKSTRKKSELERLIVPDRANWEHLSARTNRAQFGQEIDNTLRHLERANPSLKGALPIGYAKSHLNNRRLVQLFNLIGEIDLDEDASRARDTLGRIYEYFLSRFASAEARNGGEFYTPSSIVKLLVEMLEPTKGVLYDPCCGSGGMFVQSRRFFDEHGGVSSSIEFFGQESNLTTWRIARMNLAIRGMAANLGKAADTLLTDAHPDLRADFVLANPPFNVSDWGAKHLRHDPRWTFGVPPESNANYAWLQHIYSHLSRNGVAAVVLANGSVSSKASGEGDIRRHMIEADVVQAVVALPGQMFYATQIPVCVWVLASPKARASRAGQVLFIDARNFGTMETRVHKVFSSGDIDELATIYKTWAGSDRLKYKDIPGLCRSVDRSEIEKNGFVLSPGRFVETKIYPENSDQPRIEDITASLKELLEENAACDRALRETIKLLEQN